jgi:DNA-binding PadR family transcriptional regulator
MGTMKKSWKRGSDARGPERVTEPFLDIIEVFWSAENGLHGYELAKKTKRGRPTIYNNLDRLSALGWITNEWEDPRKVRGRPLRRVYRLTPEGEKLVEEFLMKSGRIGHGTFDATPGGPGVAAGDE